MSKPPSPWGGYSAEELHRYYQLGITNDPYSPAHPGTSNPKERFAYAERLSRKVEFTRSRADAVFLRSVGIKP